MKLSRAFSGLQSSGDADFSRLGRTSSRQAGTLAFADADLYLLEAEANENVAALVTTKAAYEQAGCRKPAVFSESPRAEFYALHNRLYAEGGFFPAPKGARGKGARIHPTAHVAESARIGAGAVIHEKAIVLEGAEIGEGTEVHPGAVVGADGILLFSHGGLMTAVKHAGAAIVGAGCTLLANSVVVRGVHPETPTLVGDGTLVGIGSTVGHEAKVGRNCVISGNSVIARLSEIGDGTWLGTSCVIREHVKVGARAKVAAGAVVVDDVAEDAAVAGNFAVPQGTFFKFFLRLRGGKL